MVRWSRPLALLSLSAFLAVALVACSDDGADTTATATATDTATSTATASMTATEDATPSSTPEGTATDTIVPADGGDVTSTEVVVYVAVAPAGDVVAEAAECFSDSLAAPRQNGYRCSVGNQIYDPCFAIDGTHAMCAPDPTADDPGTYIEVAVPFPTTSGTVESAPWLLQLADGTVCGFATGATGGAEDKRLNYSCTNDEWILGDVQEGDPWTAEFVTGAVGANGFAIETRHVEPLETVWR